MILIRNTISMILEDNETSWELHEELRKNFVNEMEKFEKSGNKELATIYNAILHLVNISDSISLNIIRERERTDRLIESLLKSTTEKDEEIKKLRKDIELRNKEQDEFHKKYGDRLNMVKNYFGMDPKDKGLPYG